MNKNCTMCELEKPVEDFSVDSGKVDGKRSECKPCNAEAFGARRRIYLTERNLQRVEFLAQIKLERGCADCGYNKHAVALDFDHKDGSGKHAAVSQMRCGNMEKLLAEIEKCDVVCANCHRVRTAMRGNWYGNS